MTAGLATTWDETAGTLIRRARARAGLTQEALASQAGTTQSVVSAYESGSRQPSLPTLRRLVEAAGLKLATSVIDDPGQTQVGSLRERLIERRAEIGEIVRRHGASKPRLFGSAARGDDGPDSDVDILVDLGPGTGLLDLARLERDLEEALGRRVDVVPADSLKPRVAAAVHADLLPL